MQILVKLPLSDPARTTHSLSVSESNTIGDVRSLIEAKTGFPSSIGRLCFSGGSLSDNSKTLAEYNVYNDSTLHMLIPLRGGAPKKIPRCNFKDCKDAAQRIVGDCGFCSGHFCGKHRMLESHNCTGLENCKKEEKDRNREKLESERTVAARVI